MAAGERDEIVLIRLQKLSFAPGEDWTRGIGIGFIIKRLNAARPAGRLIVLANSALQAAAKC